MKNCPNCGTPMMRGWCPNCHPNPQQMGAYKWYMGGQALQSLGCAIMLIVFIIVPLCVVLYACATS